MSLKIVTFQLTENIIGPVEIREVFIDCVFSTLHNHVLYFGEKKKLWENFQVGSRGLMTEARSPVLINLLIKKILGLSIFSRSVWQRKSPFHLFVCLIAMINFC